MKLPDEILILILSYCPRHVLVRLASVSRQLHELATEVLYASVHISLLQEEYDATRRREKPMLASKLNALTTSEYDYAAHVRELALLFEERSTALPGFLRLYQLNVPTGKMFDALMTLSLRKAVKLESFI
ncbi:MAG: hypothetical protein STHCBS139747_000025 [Sporothrix thermara]